MLGCLSKDIQKPLRYIGGELNSVVKENAPARMLLAFPDIYEIGMSHFGSRILYDTVNYRSDHAMERVYMPWRDLFAEMKRTGVPLVSVESGRSFKDFDAVGFSLQHELACTNVLAMLELGGIELLSEKRDEDTPVIIAGGGSAYNPAPMSMFIDAFVIGEADELVLEIMDVLAVTRSRKERLTSLAGLKGVYVPSIHGEGHVVEKRIIEHLDDSPIIERPIVPFLELIHDRITYEVQRGCNRGCRFCHAGMVYRPVRQRSPEQIMASIERDLENTGYRDLGFLSLNACDYSPLLKLVDWIYKNFSNRGLFVSLPSLRIESISDEFLGVLSKLPKSGFTIAPEAGSERIRKAINKDITEAETLDTISIVSKLGWDNIKSYFMIGLPGEDASDVEAIAGLARKMQSVLHGGRSRLTISVSNFVPKPHTPFQWEPQLDAEEFQKRITMLSRSLTDRRLSLKWSDPKMSEVEGVLSRGDRKIGELILDVYRKGEIFTGWGSNTEYERWLSSMRELGIKKEDYLGRRDTGSKLPWSVVSSGVDENWLKSELEKARAGQATVSCITGSCSNCGVCSSLGVSNDLKIKIDLSGKTGRPEKESLKKRADKVTRIRAMFSKQGRFRWMGHFELMNAIEKAVLRAKLPVSVSQGFKPVLLLSYSPPVGEGIDSLVELVDITFFEDVDPKEMMDSMNQQLPEEMRFKSSWKIPLDANSLNQDIRGFEWSASVLLDGQDSESIKGRIRSIDLSLEGVTIEVERKGKKKSLSLHDHVKGLNFHFSDDRATINFRTCFLEGRTVKPIEVLRVLLPGIEENRISLTRKGVNIDGIDINY